MKLKSLFSKLYLAPIIALLCAAAITGCSDDKDELQSGNGYVQFKLYKNPDAENAPGMDTRAGSDRLDYLSDANKIQVVLLSNNATITQTVPLNAYSAESAEYGLRSEKLELTAGTYTLIGYYLFDKTETQILAGEPSETTVFTVQTGGLTIQDILVNAIHRGRIKFTLTKDLSEFTGKTRATSSDKTYIFSTIGEVDITIQNTYTKEKIEYEGLKVKYQDEYTKVDGKSYTSGVGVIDTVLVAEAGKYEIVSYVTSTKTGSALGVITDKVGEAFTVTDNTLTEAEVPVSIHEADANIKDYLALKEIWEGLQGETWSYLGENYPNGTNWNFNKDIDMWGDQPGVGLNAEGRVTSLNIGDFNPKGDVPAALGELTELTVLTLGTHNDMLGGVNPEYPSGKNKDENQLAKVREDYYNRAVRKDPLASFSEVLQKGFELKGQKVQKTSRITPKDVQPGDYTNGITSIPDEIGNLVKLEQFYVANAKIKTLPEAMENLVECRDMEVYNCPLMKELPSVLAKMPNLEALNIAMNKQISAKDIFEGVQRIANGVAGQSIQILYMGSNNLEELPIEFAKMKKLGKLDCNNNNIKKLNAMGTEVNLVQLTMDHNQIEEIPENFCGVADVETFSFAYNKLKKLPNIFNAKSVYVMSSVDFSNNQIEAIEGVAADGTVVDFKGINAATINLANNKLKKFPGAIFKTGSPVTQFNLSGNGIEEFTNDDLQGDYMYMLNTLDLTYNRLSELPDKFEARAFPYLYGLDMSYNKFSKFPMVPLNISYLTVYGLRYQRDDNGNRCMRQWPTGIWKHTGLRALYLGGNDIRKVEDTETISYLIYNLDISDNPNIYINVKDVCSYIQSGQYLLIYDSTQNIVGCDYLDLE